MVNRGDFVFSHYGHFGLGWGGGGGCSYGCQPCGNWDGAEGHPRALPRTFWADGHYPRCVQGWAGTSGYECHRAAGPWHDNPPQCLARPPCCPGTAHSAPCRSPAPLPCIVVPTPDTPTTPRDEARHQRRGPASTTRPGIRPHRALVLGTGPGLARPFCRTHSVRNSSFVGTANPGPSAAN